MFHRAFIPALSAFALLLTSCTTASRLSAKWKENPVDGPWIAPGVHAREFTRSYYAGLMATSKASDTVWSTASGGRRDKMNIIGSVDRQLKQLGYFDRWPESQSDVSGYQQRLAPFTFHIVAIDPTVVIMVPHDFGNPKGNRSSFDIVGWPSDQQCSSRYMINHIEYGTTLPYHPDILWFSPSLETAPTPLIRHSTTALELVHKHIRILLKREGDIWRTERE